MKRKLRNTRLIFFSVILLSLACMLLWQPPDVRVAAPQDDEEKALYDNQEAFDCLSGAARSKLEAKYGRKNDGKEAQAGGNVTDSTGAAEASQNIAIPGAGAPIQILSALANQLVNDPNSDATARDTQSETTLVLGSGMNVIAGFNDSGSFVPPGTASSKFTGFSRSTDMGATWTDGGTLPTNPTGDAGDPVMARNNLTGRTYLSTLAFSGPGLQVFRSDDDALSWDVPVNGAAGATGSQDKEWITVDNFPGTCQENVYLVWRQFGGVGPGVRFTRSTDNGGTFGPAGGLLLAPQGAFNVQGAYVTVGPDHAVYVFWLDQSAGAGTPNIIKMRKSTDCGVTFGSAITVAQLLTTGTNGSLGAVGGFRTNSFPQAVVNPTDASKVYVVYNDNPAGVDSGDVFLRQSTDGGSTWGAAAKLNSDSTTNLQWSPSIAVKPDGSGLAVAWYDRRRDPADRLIEYWGVIASISGSTLTFSPNFRISGQFPAIFGQDPVVNAVYMGDYDRIVADNGFFYATWGDNSLPNPNFPAHQNQPDVRFAKIPMAGPGPILDNVSETISGGNGDGIIEPNECNDLTKKIMNDGTATATGIIGVLSTTTPGVTIVQPIADYPDLAPGNMATNATPFKISTAPDIPCPSRIEFTLTLTYAQGSDIVTFSLFTGNPNYVITTSGGTAIVPGTTDTGNHGDDVTTLVALPFPYTLYDQTFTSVRVSSNGNLQFVSNNAAFANTCPLPTSVFNFAILPHWDDLCTSVGCGTTPGTLGIFTSVSGVAPNRIFNIEWRVVYFPGTDTANFEVRLFEGQHRFDVIYGTVTQGGSSASVGVQRDTGSLFTQFSCNTPGSLTSGLQLAFEIPACTQGNGECPLGCVESQGFWKNHPQAWPVTSLTLGTITYNQSQLLIIFSQPVRGNGLVSLAKQLIAARLNLANGAATTPNVTQAIADANALIDGLVIPPIGSGFLPPSTTEALRNTLDNYNNGEAPGGPPACP
jgi:hypothetical protein